MTEYFHENSHNNIFIKFHRNKYICTSQLINQNPASNKYTDYFKCLLLLIST